MLRTSSYTIYVDLPDNPEDVLLVHGYSGAFDKVKRQIVSYLRSAQTTHRPKPLYGEWVSEPPVESDFVAPSQATIDSLKRRGYLTEMTVEEEEIFFVKMATKVHQIESLLMPVYIIMPTYSCNLRCSYCFQDHMRTNPAFKHLLQIMQPEIADRIFAAMPQIEAGHGVPANADVSRGITFFGGEPLLAENHSIIKYIINRASSLGQAHFDAISNGTELHAYKDLLGSEKISAVQITLDGPTIEHDKRRIYADGSGSFDKIADNITMALDLGVQVSVRMNIDRNNIQQLPDLADEIIARGWHRYEKFATYTAPIHASNEKTDVKTTFNSWHLQKALKDMRQEYPSMEVILPPDDALPDTIRQIFAQYKDPLQKKKSLPPFKASFCQAHRKMYVFDPFGDIYACWEKTGDQKIRIGQITENNQVILNEELNQTWRNRSVVTNPTCRKCPYALYCGGGCAVLAMNHTGNFHNNYCDGFASRFRANVAQAYEDHVSGAENLVKRNKPVCSC
ncbi:MAG: SPASM domain-containing protein [Goleter apudmare HA4340-LM2]|jgi:uncharacterized protein|nr:SPASM domain-containing protein [Goleter apudmare HA4340-LM2]